MTILNMVGGGKNPYQPFHLDGISDLAVVGGDAEATITWTDPGDLIVDGQTLATWSSTKLVRKTGSAPTDSSDGTLVVTETVADTYSVSGYTDTGLTNGTTYYYGAFAVADNGLETISNTESVTPAQGGWQPGANNIVYFPLEDDLDDYTGNYTLTTYNSAQIGTVGGVKCLDCTSSTAWASCSISTLPQGGATRTEMCWVKWTVSGSGEQPIWSYGQGQFNKVDCALRDGGIFWTQYGNGIYPSPAYEPTIGDWYHYAITINGSTEQKLYINGVLVSMGAISVNTDGTNLYFSHQQWGSNYGKNCISKFIVESTIRTAQEIEDYYNLTKSNYGIS